MFKNDGTFYILRSVLSSRNNSLHGKVVNTVCEPITFEVGECGFFRSLMEDGQWHTIITTAIEKLEMPDGYNRIIVSTMNSVYTFEKADASVAMKVSGAENENEI